MRLTISTSHRSLAAWLAIVAVCVWAPASSCSALLAAFLELPNPQDWGLAVSYLLAALTVYQEAAGLALHRLLDP